MNSIIPSKYTLWTFINTRDLCYNAANSDIKKKKQSQLKLAGTKSDQ